MEKYSCESHIDHALDMFVAEQKVFPIMDKIEEDKKLSTKCSYCEQAENILYQVNNFTQYIESSCGYVDNFCG